MKLQKILLFLSLFIINQHAAAKNSQAVSDLKSDETLVFFNTSAWFNPDTDHWHIPIHGWVYEPENSKIRKGLIAQSFETLYELKATPETEENFSQRVNLFLADNERNKTIVIKMNGQPYALEKSKPNGHFHTTLEIEAKVIEQVKSDDSITFHAVLNGSDPRHFKGEVNLLTANGISIISDIDDTIKLSHVNDRKKLLNHTFYLDFQVVTGMVEKYQQWLNPNGALHFISSSPWQLYPELQHFIQQAGFPEADYQLKPFRFKDKSFFNLFAESRQTKPPQIIDVLEKYPDRSFILVGDSGEQDPEIYATIQQQFPEQIVKILIRNVTNEMPNNHRFTTTFKEIETSLWQLFNNPEEISLDLSQSLATKSL